MKQGNERYLTPDDRLTEFADQVMEGKMKQPESNADDELFGLEQTIVRLNQALPPQTVDEAMVKQMQVRLNARIRREAKDAEKPFWKKWLSPQMRPQFGFAFGAIALLILLAVVTPSLTTDGSSTTGTALTPMNNWIAVGALVVGVLVTFWIMRRK